MMDDNLGYDRGMHEKKNAQLESNSDLIRQHARMRADWKMYFEMSLKPTTHNTPPILVFIAWTYHN